MYTSNRHSEPVRHHIAPRVLRSLVLVPVALVLAASAQARVETLRWEHPNPAQVDGFRIYVGEQPGSYTRTVNAGKPNAQGGVFEYGLSVGDAETVYVAVSAYNDGGVESPLSNERVRQAPSDGGDGDDGGSDGDGDGSGDGSGGSDGGSGGTGGDGDGGSDGGAPNAILYEDLEVQSVGTFVPGWVDTGPKSSLSEDDSLFRVSELSGNRVLSTNSTQTDIHSHYVAGDSQGWSSYEVSGRMRGSSASSRLGVTAYSGFPASDRYYRIGTHWQTAELELFRHPKPDGSFDCANAGTGTTLHEDTWYRFRMRVQPTPEGTRVQAKAWRAGASEPVAWSADCTDTRSGRPSSGTIGLWSGSGGIKYWDDLQVIPLDEVPLGPPGRPVLVVP